MRSNYKKIHLIQFEILHNYKNPTVNIKFIFLLNRLTYELNNFIL